MSRFVLVAGLALAGIASSASAEFITPDAGTFGWERGTSGLSTYAEWNFFTSSTGPNAPDVGSFLGGTLAVGAAAFNVFDANALESGSFVTGGGNIYSPSGILGPQIEFGGFGLGDGYVTTVLLQIRTLGTELDFDTLSINGTTAPTAIVELERIPLGGFGGAQVDTLVRFDLVGNLASYVITGQALESSLSLDRVAIDTFTTVPAPGAFALLGLGGLFSLPRRRD